MKTIQEEKIIEAHNYWYKHRLLFNILVGLSGLCGLLLFGFFTYDLYTITFIVLGSIMWGLVANGLYSLGFELDCIIIKRTNGKKSLGNNRVLLFGVGTILYILASLFFTFAMTIPIPD
ncbi:MAG: hypothetical protein IPF63_03895 [Bacteroidetes bacterium]|nr:hypothetical protein [Bacteroidota bacterium]